MTFRVNTVGGLKAPAPDAQSYIDQHIHCGARVHISRPVGTVHERGRQLQLLRLKPHNLDATAKREPWVLGGNGTMCTIDW